MIDVSILERIKKLLKLSESSNPHEAALAAQRASELMFKYNVNKAALDTTEAREQVEYSLFEKGGTNKNNFKGQLANVIATFFDAKIVWNNSDLYLVGTNSDWNAVKYLYSAVSNQIEELTELFWNKEGKQSAIHGKTWKLSFRTGCADKVYLKLIERKNTMKSEDFKEGSRELAVIDQHKKDINDFIKNNMRFTEGKAPQRNINMAAYISGSNAAGNVNIGGNESLANRYNMSNNSLAIGLK